MRVPGYLERWTSTVNLASEGVWGPGRKLSVCSMLKDEMETLVGAERELQLTAERKDMKVKITPPLQFGPQ